MQQGSGALHESRAWFDPLLAHAKPLSFHFLILKNSGNPTAYCTGLCEAQWPVKAPHTVSGGAEPGLSLLEWVDACKQQHLWPSEILRAAPALNDSSSTPCSYGPASRTVGMSVEEPQGAELTRNRNWLLSLRISGIKVMALEDHPILSHPILGHPVASFSWLRSIEKQMSNGFVKSLGCCLIVIRDPHSPTYHCCFPISEKFSLLCKVPIGSKRGR